MVPRKSIGPCYRCAAKLLLGKTDQSHDPSAQLRAALLLRTEPFLAVAALALPARHDSSYGSLRWLRPTPVSTILPSLNPAITSLVAGLFLWKTCGKVGRGNTCQLSPS
jgi:hypothetical protein